MNDSQISTVVWSLIQAAAKLLSTQPNEYQATLQQLKSYLYHLQSIQISVDSFAALDNSALEQRKKQLIQQIQEKDKQIADLIQKLRHVQFALDSIGVS